LFDRADRFEKDSLEAGFVFLSLCFGERQQDKEIKQTQKGNIMRKRKKTLN
jgi:hypothetical protein